MWQHSLVPAARLVLVVISTASAACAQSPPTPAPTVQSMPAVKVELYPWLAATDGALPPTAPLAAIYPAPPGHRRMDAEEGSFAAWLRGLPVLLERELVHDFRGRPIPSAADAVLLMDVGRGDLQQCADTLIRLHAEYLWHRGTAQRAAYHFTSGDLSTWTDWLAGTRIEVRGSRVERRPGSPRDADHASYRAWLQQLFVYAGTLSLALDSAAVPVEMPLQGGDFFVDPGSPGHAVMLLDVAENDHGQRVALVGQGFTPAQELHVIGDGSAADGVWFPLPRDATESLDVPTWSPFPRSSARRFAEP